MPNINFTCPYCALNMCSLKRPIEDYAKGRPLDIHCNECERDFTLILPEWEEGVAHFLGIPVAKEPLCMPSLMAHQDFAAHLERLADDFDVPDSSTAGDLRDAARRIRELAVRPATIRSMIKTIQMDVNNLGRLLDA